LCDGWFCSGALFHRLPHKVPKGIIIPLKSVSELVRVKAPVQLRFDDKVFEFTEQKTGCSHQS
jgi:hypothetical protein